MTHLDSLQPYVRVGLVLIPALYAGLVAGVSFIATPVKFAAPTLSRTAALDVGRHTFALFSTVEWVVWGVFALLVVLDGFRRPWTLAALALGGLLALQGLWLLPSLDLRVLAIMKGESPPPSMLHLLYALAEACKFLILAGLAAYGLFLEQRIAAVAFQGRAVLL